MRERERGRERKRKREIDKDVEKDCDRGREKEKEREEENVYGALFFLQNEQLFDLKEHQSVMAAEVASSAYFLFLNII